MITKVLLPTNVVELADLDTFVLLDHVGKWAKSKNDIFWERNLVENVDISTF